MLPIECLPREDQLLINSMASFLKSYDITNIGLVFEVLMFADFDRKDVEKHADNAIAVENDRRRLEESGKRLQALPDQFAKSTATDGLLGAAAVAACTVMALGFHFVTPLVWAVFV